MQIRIHETDKTITIEVSGEIEITTIREFKEKVFEVGRRGEKGVIIDFNGVTYLDSSGIGILLTLYKMQKAKNLDVHMINCSDNIMKILDLSSLREIIK